MKALGMFHRHRATWRLVAIVACTLSWVLVVSASAEDSQPSPTLEERVARLESSRDEGDSQGRWDGFEFEGYLRAGFGSDLRGGPMEAFQAPNAGAKYRLGNEADAYVETAFRQWVVPKADEMDFFTQVRLSYYLPTSNNNLFDATLALREAFAQASGIIASDPEASAWAGQRFYDRWDIHMNDFYYRDLSGFGGGIQDVSVGSGKMAFAWIGGTVSEVNSDGSPFVEPEAVFNQNTFDLRWYDAALPAGRLGLSLSLVAFNGDAYLAAGETEPRVAEDATGLAGGIYYTLEKPDSWRNRLVAQYGTGPASSFKAVIAGPQHLELAAGDTLRTSELGRLLIVDELAVDFEGPWSLGASFVYENYDLGQGGADKLDWFSLGIRPIYFFSDHYSIALEAGWDHTDTEGGARGSLGKLTLAPQISPAPSFWSRPSLRAFITYAFWSDEFRGAVAPSAHGDRTDGLSLGVQMESWF